VSPQQRPRVAVVNDYEVVVAGLAALLEPFQDRIEVVDAVTIDEPIEGPVDIDLFDTFGRDGLGGGDLVKLLGRPEVERVAVYSFNMDEDAVQQAFESGASGYLSKAATATELVDQLCRLADGEQVVAAGLSQSRAAREERGWPGRDLGLSEREAEVVALAAMGKRNAQIAEALYVSVDTVKTHLARSFRKLGVHNRTELSALIHRRPSFRRFLPDEDS
jgi:two-component system, NarL family, response regulator LiaR